VSAVSEAFLAKARESLEGADSEFLSGRYNNVANRAYYACFQAAVAALEAEGIRPLGGKAEWGHAFVQSRFTGLLVNRRKVYPAELRDTLHALMSVRQRADYEREAITEPQAMRALNRARRFVDTIGSHLGGDDR
jgi:uncharacterized protein (UPF0332 family)